MGRQSETKTDRVKANVSLDLISDALPFGWLCWASTGGFFENPVNSSLVILPISAPCGIPYLLWY